MVDFWIYEERQVLNFVEPRPVGRRTVQTPTEEEACVVGGSDFRSIDQICAFVRTFSQISYAVAIQSIGSNRQSQYEYALLCCDNTFIYYWRRSAATEPRTITTNVVLCRYVHLFISRQKFAHNRKFVYLQPEFMCGTHKHPPSPTPFNCRRWGSGNTTKSSYKKIDWHKLRKMAQIQFHFPWTSKDSDL